MEFSHRRGWRRLFLATLAIAVVWLLVLPWIGSHRTLRARIEQMDRQGIDPTALYYTDLEAMGRLEADVAATLAAHPEAFW